MPNQDEILLEAFATDLGKEKGNVFRMLSDTWISQEEIIQEYKKQKVPRGNWLKIIVLKTFYKLQVVMILSSLEQQDEVVEGKSEVMDADNTIYFRRKSIDELAQSFEDYEPPPKFIFDMLKEKLHDFFTK